jgi:signal transduction histidine kinase
MPLKILPNMGIRGRFMLLAMLLTLLFSGLWGEWAWVRERQLLLDRLHGQGEVLVSSMAIPIINALLYEELGIIAEGGLLDNFIADIMANRQLQPLYAMVISSDGRVLAHNRLPEFGEIYDDPTTRAALASSGVLHTRAEFEGKPALEFSAPLAIAGKSWGCLRVGVSLLPLHKELKVLAGNIVGFALLFSMGALGVFFFAGQKLARPILTLAESMENMDINTPSYLPQKARYDEIGRLERSFHDLLERLHQSEEERQRSLERLVDNERFAAVGKLVSGIAHEVNNPLSGIQGALYHISEEGTPATQNYVKAAEQGVERISRILGQLLDLSRADALYLEPVDSVAFFEELALFARMAIKKKNCTLQIADNYPQQVVRLDRDRIHQTVLNLILNAADAVAGQEESIVRLETFAHDQGYAIRVIDNGPGISSEIQKQIFEPFFTTKGPGKGTGMGLAIGRTIAEKHDGRLECRSAPGQGTLFTLWLPQDLSTQGILHE